MIKASEHAHQVTLINWFDRTYPHLKGRLFAIPNGGYRAKSVAISLSMEGVRRGVPDLFLPIASRDKHGLFIELKAEKGRASTEQKDWILFLNQQGYSAHICFGWIDASLVINEHLNAT